MTSSLFGWNVNAQEAPESVVLDIIRRTKARSHTVMNGLGLAKKVYDVVGQVTGEQPVIACREDWPDGEWQDSRYSSMASYFNQWKTRGGYWPEAHVYWLNEPFVGNDIGKVRSLLNKSIEAMTASADTHVKAVIGNYPDASLFEKHWLDAGEFDAWARAASQYTEGGYGYIGHHNYTYGLTWTGSAGVPYTQLRTTNPTPPTREAFQQTHVWENWLQGRFLWPLVRCDHLKIPRYKFICTEGVWDRMPSGEFEGWIPQAEAFWGLGKLRGPLDQRALWGKLYPTISQALAGVRQLEALAALMAGLSCYGIHLFTLSNNIQWITFNFLNWPEFINELATYAARAVWTPGVSTMATPKPTTPLIHATCTGLPTGTTRRNIRADATSDSADIGDLLVGDRVRYQPVPPAPANNGWVRLIKETGNIDGWISMVAGVTFETIVPDTPDTVEVALLKAQIATLTTQLDTATKANAALQAQVENYRSVLSSAKGLSTDIHEQGSDIHQKAGHLYTLIDSALESVDGVPT